MTTVAARLLVLAAAALPVALTACSDTPQRTESNYCTQVNDHLSDLNAGAITTDADIARVLDAWRSVADVAPIAIEAEWSAMVRNLETAATVDPNDQASLQKVADIARESEPAANRVIAYTRQKCGALIGSVAPTATTTAPAADPSITADAGVTTTTA